MIRYFGINTIEIALKLGYSHRQIERYCHNSKPKLWTLVAICVEFNIPYNISKKLIELLADETPYNNYNIIYKQFLINTREYTIERCNREIMLLNKAYGNKIHYLGKK